MKGNLHIPISIDTYYPQVAQKALELGAQSTRPGHVEIPPEQELARLAPVLERLKGNLHIPISIDKMCIRDRSRRHIAKSFARLEAIRNGLKSRNWRMKRC